MKRAVLVALLVSTCAACTYEKDIGFRPPLGGVPGATTQSEVAPPKNAPKNLEAAPEGKIVIDDEGGNVRLISRSARHLMIHIQRLLADKPTSEEQTRDRALFVEQVLSESTVHEYLDRGLDPGQAYDTLKEREEDILLLFSRMPMGEHSPNVMREKVGDRVHRVRLTGQATKDLRWTGFDMVLERGNWTLRWFF